MIIEKREDAFDGASSLFVSIRFRWFYTNKKRQEFLSCRYRFLLDADSPGTNRVVVKELTDNPTDQSFYL